MLHRIYYEIQLRFRYFYGCKLIMNIDFSKFISGHTGGFNQCAQNKVGSHTVFSAGVDVYTYCFGTGTLSLPNGLGHIKGRQILGCLIQLLLYQSSKQMVR